jgi:bifunctional DNA-binding transcriptional regulator/antitoxin component of YhaV-PrlF toxin-antitoxin module
MIVFMIMRISKITRGGQISLPADVRRRWNTSRIGMEDLGDKVIIRPAPDDPIAAARGAFAGQVRHTSEELRAIARGEEHLAESRRRR